MLPPVWGGNRHRNTPITATAVRVVNDACAEVLGERRHEKSASRPRPWKEACHLKFGRE